MAKQSRRLTIMATLRLGEFLSKIEATDLYPRTRAQWEEMVRERIACDVPFKTIDAIATEYGTILPVIREGSRAAAMVLPELIAAAEEAIVEHDGTNHLQRLRTAVTNARAAIKTEAAEA